MQEHKEAVIIGEIGIPLSRVSLGTWALGGDIWWGKQDDRSSNDAMETAIDNGINLFDTAPVYGRGRSERLIGDFLRKRRLRDKVAVATKAGLSWKGAAVFHNLKRQRILEEVDESRTRLQSDYLDLYQVHWPDPATPIPETAQALCRLRERGTVRAVGVCNFSVNQIIEFRKHCPLDAVQLEYSLFNRKIEAETLPYCLENGIGVLSYSPLFSGLLTGKFFLPAKKLIPADRARREKSAHFEEPLFSINRDALKKLNSIAEGYGKTLTQLAVNWNFSRKGIASSIAGSRSPGQVSENAGSLSFRISDSDIKRIDEILLEREREIRVLRLSD